MDAPEPLRLRFDLFELDEPQARLLHAGRTLALPPKAFGVLCALVRRPGQLLAKSALLDAVWGHQYVSDSVLKTTISELRAALGDDARRPRFIETASRRGYRFIGAVQPAGEAADMPVPAEPAAAPGLIGREAALRWLHESWADALAGQRRVVWITGEAGIGKTTLIGQFVAGLGPGVAAHGQCVEQHGAGEPYLPVLEALAALCRDDPALPALLRSVAPTWLLQLPWLGEPAELERLRQQLAGSGQERMLREFGELLDRCTLQRPLLLVTEDLHWSDHATLRLIDHVARRRGPARLLWLASFRLAEVIAEEHPLKALRHELRLHRLADERVLDPFSEREVADYLVRRLPGRPVSEALARSLHARTDGLPLFVARVADELAATGAQAPEPPGTMPPVPESLAGVIERQIARLPPEQRVLLEAASVCGVEFRASTLAAVLDRAEAAVGERCDDLVRRQQWLNAIAVERAADGRIEARYAFRHALYRQVFYQRCGALTQARLHQGVAAALLRRRATGAAVASAELALHHELSEDPAAAVRHYAEAADSALRHFAPTEAMSLSEHALALLPRCPEGVARLELELMLLGPRVLAASQVLGVTAPETRALFERVDQLCERVPAQTPRVHDMGLGLVQFVAGEYEAALAQARRKLALAEQRGDRVLWLAAAHLSGAVLAYQGRLAESRQWLERGLASTGGLDQRGVGAQSVVDFEVSMRSRLAQVLTHLGEVDAAQRELAAATDRADRIGQPYTRRLLLIYDCFVAMQLDRPERVQTLADALQRLATDHGITQAEGTATWLHGWALARQGAAEAGLALIREGYARDQRLGMRRGAPAVLGYAAEALIIAGRFAEAQQTLDEAQALAEEMGERLSLPELLMLRSRIAIGRGRPETARDSLQAALHEAEAQQALWLELAARCALCELSDASPADVAALRRTRERIAAGRDSASTPIARAEVLLRRAAPRD